MVTNLRQQYSARHIPTHHHFNIFGKLRLMLVAGLLLLPQLLAAQWNATAGAESNDLGRQALAFLHHMDRGGHRATDYHLLD